MYIFVVIVHVIICFLLVGVILIQSGRGGGLADSFSSAESIFGTKTNSFLTRSTSVLAVLFIVTCVSLTFMSIQKSKSLMGRGSFSRDELIPVSAGAPKEANKEEAKPIETPAAVEQKAQEADVATPSK